VTVLCIISLWESDEPRWACRSSGLSRFSSEAEGGAGKQAVSFTGTSDSHTLGPAEEKVEWS
jgi:hypothetical protein